MTVTPPREVGTVVINLNAVAWVVELTFSHAVVKCKSLVARHSIACGDQIHFSAFVSPAEKRARKATVRRVAL